LNANQCWQVTLTCTSGDCSPAQPRPAPPPTPAPSPTTPVPPAQQVGRNPTGATTTTIRNNTPYILQVSLVGSVTRSATVAAGGSQLITLTPGSYMETVRATSGNVQPLSGRQTYLQGFDYVETFTIVTR
jgi:hypothetical protein